MEVFKFADQWLKSPGIGVNFPRLLASLILSISLLTGCSRQQFEEFGGSAGATFGEIANDLSAGFSAAITSWEGVRLAQKSSRVRAPRVDQRLYGYRPATNQVYLKFNKGYASPKTLSSRQQTTIYNDYSLSLPPSSGGQVEVTYEWKLRKRGQVLIRSKPVVLLKKAGGYRAIQRIKIPKNAESGSYIYEIKLSSGGVAAVNKVVFVVK